MLKLIAAILEKFTLDIIPKFPINFRTSLYVNLLKLRKVRDSLRIRQTQKNPTFNQRLEYAIDSRYNLNKSGQKLLKYCEEVKLTEVEDAPVRTYMFTPENCDEDKYAIYFHGGGYFAGSIDSHKNFVSQLSRKSNLIIYFFEYRLSPENNFPAAHDDAKKAVDFIRNLHPNEISIWIGESAGGGLATGLVVDSLFDTNPDKLVLMSPWLDLSDKSQDRKFLKNRDVTILIDGMFDVGKHYAGNYGTDHPILSPIFANIESFPDVLIQVCTDELLYIDSIEFEKKLKDKGFNVQVQKWSGVWHAWHFFPIKEAQEAIDKIIEFIKSKEFHSSK